MANRKECVCFARYSGECCCPGVDWTPQEVIDLRQQLLAAQADNKRLRDALAHCNDYPFPHGENCFVSDHYDGDPGNRCNCGRDSLLEHVTEAISTPLLSALARHEAGVLEEAASFVADMETGTIELVDDLAEELVHLDVAQAIRRLAADRPKG